ncbi:PspC domain-containing protein [Pontixanthobacter sp.]|uniref:PspC domain-containing protein n=1 Tax=Pontixanthobacter sp. TaxID=2792078 RepID=UPI003C7B2BAF
MSQLEHKNAGGSPSKGFRLDRANAKIWGVCSGISNSTGIDPVFIRIGFVIGALASVGTAALIYAGIGLIAD